MSSHSVREWIEGLAGECGITDKVRQEGTQLKTFEQGSYFRNGIGRYWPDVLGILLQDTMRPGHPRKVDLRETCYLVECATQGRARIDPISKIIPLYVEPFASALPCDIAIPSQMAIIKRHQLIPR